MTWNYRVIQYDDGSFGLHEVFYDDNGKPNACTESAAGFVPCAEEGLEGIIKSLENALNDAGQYPVLDREIFTQKRKSG